MIFSDLSKEIGQKKCNYFYAEFLRIFSVKNSQMEIHILYKNLLEFTQPTHKSEILHAFIHSLNMQNYTYMLTC